MDEHMMAAQIAALTSEIETLKQTVKRNRVNVFEIQCTRCTGFAPKWVNYCPHCGAKFEEVTDGR